MKQPEVISGMRPPRADRLEKIRQDTVIAQGVPDVPARDDAAETVYVSNVRRYRVQVACQPDVVDPLTGRRQAGRNIAAQFEDGVYRNRERDPKRRTLIDAALQSNPEFGLFGGGPQVRFWLASQQEAAMREARLRAARDTLRALPAEAVEEFVAGVLAQSPGAKDDHEVTPPELKASPIRG